MQIFTSYPLAAPGHHFTLIIKGYGMTWYEIAHITSKYTMQPSKQLTLSTNPSGSLWVIFTLVNSFSDLNKNKKHFREKELNIYRPLALASLFWGDLYKLWLIKRTNKGMRVVLTKLDVAACGYPSAKSQGLLCQLVFLHLKPWRRKRKEYLTLIKKHQLDEC